MVKAAFTGSFDPAHEGHRYIVEQARRLGFEVQVIVANNVDKIYQHSPMERVQNAQKLFSVHEDDGITVAYCDADNIGTIIKKWGCEIIIRGVRNTKDFEYEQKIADYNRSVNGLETIYIPCPPDLRDMSSTKIRENNG